MSNTLPRRFILVARPSVHAAIGEALRKAFQGPEYWSVKMYEKLIAKLDREQR